MSAPASPAVERNPRVSVLAVATRADWLAVAGVWIGLAVVSSASYLGPQGANAWVWWQVGLGFFLDSLVWIALMPGLFAVLDRVSWRRGRLLLATSSYFVALVLVSALHAAIARPLVLGLARIFDPTTGPASAPEIAWWTFTWGDFGNSWIGVAAHVVLQRIHSDRLRQERASRLEVLLGRAQLAALTRQLEPHFLFNTLNGIAALIHEAPATAEAMLVRLSDLLRLTLDEQAAPELALGEELERLDLYLSIQQMRLGARLTVHQDIAPETLTARVPSMLLQPLVENALTHGIVPRPGPGRIDIVARIAEGRLELLVRDDGVGLTAGTATDGTGLRNTRARLVAMFPELHELTLRPNPRGGAEVGITVPFETPRGATGAFLARPARHANDHR